MQLEDFVRPHHVAIADTQVWASCSNVRLTSGLLLMDSTGCPRRSCRISTLSTYTPTATSQHPRDSNAGIPRGVVSRWTVSRNGKCRSSRHVRKVEQGQSEVRINQNVGLKRGIYGSRAS